jgi:hypothetical protein
MGLAKEPIKMKELIVRTPSLTSYYAGGDYWSNVDELVANAKKSGFEAISILVRTVDDDCEIGAMMYESNVPFTYSYSCGDTVWNDEMLQYLIDAVHNAGMLAYAWFTSFNDNGYYSAFEESRTQPDLGEEFGKFVSPANDDVRAHELAIIKEFMIDKGFGFDGIRLDYLRYQSEEQPQDVAAVAKYDELYQKNLLQVISDRQGEVENWEQFLRWRASLLLSFTEEVKNLIGDSKRLGAYLMPHSGISEGGYITPNYAGNSYPNCWSGVDFELYKSLDMDIIPMLYWNDFHPIYEGDSKWDWVGGSMEHTQEFVSPNSNYMPCMSLSYENDEWAEAINIMRANNLTDIVVFHWAGGGYDQAVFDKINEIKHDANSGTGISITTDGNNATTLNS